MGAIGLHIERAPDRDRLYRCLDAWKPNDVVLVGDGTGARSDLRHRYPDLRIWLRHYPDDNASLHMSSGTYIQKVVSPLCRLPYFLAADNEPPFSDDKVLWWRDVVRGCTDHGLRCALPGFPIGGPQTSTYEPDSLQLIPRAKPLIDAIIAGNHVLRLNEYAGIFWDSGWAWDERLGFRAPQATLSPPEEHDDNQYHCGRWKFWVKQYGNDLNILIGENGFDTIDGDPAMHDFATWINQRIKYGPGLNKWGPVAAAPFWREAFGAAKTDDQLYGMQLILMAQNMYAENNILGQCTFVYSEETPAWQAFDVSHREELWDIIGDYNGSLKETASE